MRKVTRPIAAFASKINAIDGFRGGVTIARDFTDSTGTGREGLLKAAAESYDAIVLDRMLPGGLDGLGTLATLRTAGIETPGLILSALSGMDERVRGLRAGGALRGSALPAMPDEYLQRGKGKSGRQKSARHKMGVFPARYGPVEKLNWRTVWRCQRRCQYRWYGSMNCAVRSGNIAMITVFCPTPGERRTSPKPPRRLPGRTALVAVGPLLCTLLLPAGAALAQEARGPNETPARIGNIWGGFDHQPTESQVQSAERASGVAPSAQEQRRKAQIVQHLGQELLMTSAGVGRTGAAAG